jgi:geranylgeranyl diphosphate synthase type II
MNTNLQAYLQQGQIDVDQLLSSYLPKEDPKKYTDIAFYESLRYSLFAGGKRLRPNLCFAAAESVGGLRQDVLSFASALELIHTYSLIHDDLPSMDNDDLRRGKPTHHKVYGEGTAILAGDALLTAAFTLIAEKSLQQKISPQSVLEAILELGFAAGLNGMVLGQFMDMQSEGKKVMDQAMLTAIHKNKTGALIRASVRIGGIIAQATPIEQKSLTEYGEYVGLAFQIMDDVLDVTGNEKELGKAVGQDKIKEKWTYPRLVGVKKAEEDARQLSELAIIAILSFGASADPLRWIASYAVNRKN